MLALTEAQPKFELHKMAKQEVSCFCLCDSCIFVCPTNVFPFFMCMYLLDVYLTIQLHFEESHIQFFDVHII